MSRLLLKGEKGATLGVAPSLFVQGPTVYAAKP